MVIDLNTTQKDSIISKTLVIAEAGVNHNGDIQRAKKLIDFASDAGADIVKFQTFKAENLVVRSAEKAQYQKRLTNHSESQFDMIKKLELSKSDHFELIQHCTKRNIQFLSTAFDIDSIDFLMEIDVPFLKIPSGEITNLPYLRHIGSMRKPVIMSTGMSDLYEISSAIKILCEQGLKKKDITVLHCNTEYPSPVEDVNLRAMLTIKKKLDVEVGYSDHTLGIEVPVAAVALGATVIEKHFTLDRNDSGPDHAASLEPGELNSMVEKIRNIEKALGSNVKKPSKSEKKNIIIARKSLVAKTNINRGEKFSSENLTAKRPGSGISPMKWDSVIGKVSNFNFAEDDIIIL